VILITFFGGQWAVLALLMFVVLGGSPVGEYGLEDPVFTVRLELHADGTYVQGNHGDSCWLWFEQHGRWREENGLIVLESDEATVFETANIESRGPSEDETLTIEVHRSSGRPWANADVSLGDGTIHACADDAGIARFSAADLARLRGRREWITVGDDRDMFRVVGESGCSHYVVRVARGRPSRQYFYRDGDALAEIGGGCVLPRLRGSG
jgi:hypothetical protein